MKAQFLVVGRIRRPVGLKGQLEIDCLTDFPSRFRPDQKVYLSPPSPHFLELTIKQAQSKGKRIILQFAEIDNRTSIEKIVGRLLQVRIEEAEEIPAGTYWHHQIIGLKVVNVDGKDLGTVKEIIRTGSNDIYIISRPGKELLIPATKEVIKKVDLEKGLMTVKLLPGLKE